MLKTTKKPIIFLQLMLIVLLALLAGCRVQAEPTPGGEEPQLPTPKTLSDPREIELYSQLLKAAEGRDDLAAFLIYRVVIDRVDFSRDGMLALAWLAMVDRQTGLVLPGEPGLVIARKASAEESQWQFTFQADADFANVLTAVPEKMLSDEDKEFYKPGTQAQSKGVVYRGYHLPWKNGETVRLTGSIGHVYTYKTCPTTCLYAFDFANGTMFPVHAARQGTVKSYNWDSPNGNPSKTNFIVLEDTTTTPTTYQVYAHLAYDSIPAKLRKVGVRVAQGEFIGNVDDTGASSGHHLHFHVHTNSTSWWGTSVDIVFDEVSINGGRPRQCSEAQAFPQFGKECMPGERYTSRNADVEKPTGGISDPVPYAVITAPTLNVSGWMKDDGGVESAQILYNTGGKWKPIGALQKSNPFTTSIDLCEARVPDGTFFLSLEVKDLAGKLSEGEQGLTELKKNYKCPPLPPVCTPAETQVALYSEIEYQGKCQLLELGKYNDLDDQTLVKADQAHSLQVGSGVTALTYAKTGFEGTFEMFQNGDDNLADNPIEAANIASIKVVTRIVSPIPPTIKLPEVINTETELKISWTAEEEVKSRADLTGPAGYTNTLDWQDGNKWEIGKLAAGDYSLNLEVKNLAGTVSVTQTFSVVPAPEPPVSRMLELPEISSSTALMLQWEVLSEGAGIDHFELQWRKANADWQDWGEPINPEKRELLFWAQQSKKYIFRIRAVDTQGMQEAYPTDGEVTTMVNGGCTNDEFEGEKPGDDQKEGAALIAYGSTQLHSWCPVGDVDWVSFTAAQEDEIRLTIKPLGFSSEPVAQLFDSDGTTYIGEVRIDPEKGTGEMLWTVPVEGNYYIKLTAQEPRIGGVDAQYEVGIELKSSVKPPVIICGGVTIPTLLGGGYFALKMLKKRKLAKKKTVYPGFETESRFQSFLNKVLNLWRNKKRWLKLPF